MTRNGSRSEIVQLEIAIAGTHQISVIPSKISIYLKKLKKQGIN